MDTRETFYGFDKFRFSIKKPYLYFRRDSPACGANADLSVKNVEAAMADHGRL
jgi:hypothetical protein